MKTAIKIACLSLGLMAVTACGFKPIYATPAGESAPANMQIAIASVSAPEETHAYVTDALRKRIVLREGESPKYELSVNARERAQPLAVQIDATVTRYNYRLSARYRLRVLETNEVINGKADAIASYNIVSSIYSTLHAEREVREKASRLLAEDIERDILLRLKKDADAAEIPEAENINDLLEIDNPAAERDSFSNDEQPFLINEEKPDAEGGEG